MEMSLGKVLRFRSSNGKLELLTTVYLYAIRKSWNSLRKPREPQMRAGSKLLSIVESRPDPLLPV
ncbi:hypothetical protein CK203_001096 [Vitis vinifera]|uniref:Uncharacterized protein n=1 Tax=Vitis vinifera TaxID=29760 RepID=A0A438F6K7_VITVI|nr:hypothetical protein CK203_102827 [Vitis vinifera]RVX21912.1 hypothetical protein CK203_001096 [Vitis vinifera]